ncbi:MAG TPA: SMC-Scp complex subunit ScpB [Candidatus Norongarragalinales archaeon]|jgi:chromosome segregation and condensation protein ScpB|nr:SMC-Scp complex subunit ScpB [Candidatus Norongarragalinales archaeon]
MGKARFVIEEEEIRPEQDAVGDFDGDEEGNETPSGENPQPQGALENTSIKSTGELADAEETELAKQEIPELKPILPEVAPTNEKLEPLKVIEAALFLSNKPMMAAELALIAKTSVKEASRLVHVLQKQYESNDGAVQLVVENGAASLQIKPQFLAPVAKLSREVELSRKATRILALVAKKGMILQSELKHYFRGEIYQYVTELKEKQYVTAERKGLTRLLKPTKKFFESYQIAQ